MALILHFIRYTLKLDVNYISFPPAKRADSEENPQPREGINPTAEDSRDEREPIFPARVQPMERLDPPPRYEDIVQQSRELTQQIRDSLGSEEAEEAENRQNSQRTTPQAPVQLLTPTRTPRGRQRRPPRTSQAHQ